MCTLRPFRVTDIFKFNRVNLDPLTETYDTRFYLSYLARFPEYFTVVAQGWEKIYQRLTSSGSEVLNFRPEANTF